MIQIVHKNILRIPSHLLFGFILCFSFLFSPEIVHGEEVTLSEEALVNLVKPSVVRIVEHVSGTARIPAVKVDIRQGLVAVIPDRYTDVPVNEFLSGSGYIISPDGYIATNAHVVSLETVKLTLASESALSAIFENALILSDEEMQNFLDDEGGKNFSREVVKYVMDNSEFNLENKIAVLHPDSKETKFSSLIDEGFPAEAVSINENFIDSELDVALLKIDETNLPSLSLGSSEELTVGKKVYIFGFPATAEVNQNNPLEATFTQGVVSAIKQSTDKSFKIFQTDAKVSQGSSGGPLFNEKGEVVGIITFQTTELNRTSGDNFAFALPVELVKSQASEARVDTREGAFGVAFKKGFQSFTERHCEDAVEFFEEAKNVHPAFSVAGSIDSYVDKCQELQKIGASVDTYWERFQGKAETLGSPLLYIIGGSLFFFGIFGASIFWLLRQVRRDEKEIAQLERRVLADEMRIVQFREGTLKGQKTTFTEKNIPQKPKKV